jgi:two-component system, NarL family, nitrate/nitrite response regulator NarL
VIRVGAIDDDRMLLAGIEAFLSPFPDLSLVAAATSVDDYVAQAPRADVVLLDLNLRDLSPPAGNVTRLRAAGYTVLVVSVIPDTEHVLATMEAGAAGYLTKDHDLQALVDAVRKVAAGETVVTPELAFIISGDQRPGRPQLSAQERRVLLAYASGYTLQATARKAGVSVRTAREYLERVRRKYAEVGRPVNHKLDLAARVREDRLERDGLPGEPGD